MKEYNKFEKARILGARSLQISMGAPILVKRPKNEFDVIKIAQLEYEADKLPITIKRFKESN